MEQPDNHFARRAEDRASQGLTPERPAAWPMVLVAILCWAVLVIGFTLLALPFIDWALNHPAVHSAVRR